MTRRAPQLLTICACASTGNVRIALLAMPARNLVAGAGVKPDLFLAVSDHHAALVGLADRAQRIFKETAKLFGHHDLAALGPDGSPRCPPSDRDGHFRDRQRSPGGCPGLSCGGPDAKSVLPSSIASRERSGRYDAQGSWLRDEARRISLRGFHVTVVRAVGSPYHLGPDHWRQTLEASVIELFKAGAVGRLIVQPAEVAAPSMQSRSHRGRPSDRRAAQTPAVCAGQRVDLRSEGRPAKRGIEGPAGVLLESRCLSPGPRTSAKFPRDARWATSPSSRIVTDLACLRSQKRAKGRQCRRRSRQCRNRRLISPRRTSRIALADEETLHTVDPVNHEQSR